MRALLVAFLVAALPGVAAAGNGKKLFGMVGDDAQAIAVVDVAQVRGSATFQKLVTLAGASGTMAQLTSAGIGPSDVDTLLVAMGDSTSPSLAIAEGTFTDAEVKQVADSLGDTATTHGGVSYYAGTDHEIGLIGKKLVIARKGGIAAVIDRLKKKSHTLLRGAKAAGLRAAIAMTDTRHDMWIAAGSADFLTRTAKGLTALSMGVSLQSDVAVQVKVKASDADTAAAIAKQADAAIDYGKSLLSQAGLTGLAASLTSTVDDTVVEVDADLPGAELDDFVKLVGSFI